VAKRTVTFAFKSDPSALSIAGDSQLRPLDRGRVRRPLLRPQAAARRQPV